ncbi:hypothetical protein A4H02_08630 [Fervidobacterium thailandense]|uniref:Uncharacterized protein n=1 Tax=Fervidobacterium thailandense TaxID=1008305 RepID=A0A1E3G0N7_9BACT|nr:hypothetical protein A4H02_08630 [Fervidobacterium thailandense]
MLFYLLFIIHFGNRYKSLFIIQSLVLLNTVINISFLYTSLEDFNKITQRGILSRLLCVALILMLVRKPSDFIKYALIGVMYETLANIWMWFGGPVRLSFRLPKFSEIKLHLVGALKLFIPLLAIQVYVVLDKTMVGLLTDESLFDDMIRVR